MKIKYTYPAIFHPEADGGYSVSFPQMRGCFTQGDTFEDAVKMATEAMSLYLFSLEEDGEPVPKEDAKIVADSSDLVVAITAWMQPFREEMKNRAVKKTLTIPAWLNQVGEEAGINFSQLLQSAIKERLGIH